MISEFIHQRIIFQGTPLPRHYRFEFDYPFEEYQIPTPDGEWLHLLFFPVKGNVRGQIIYFHGNAGNLQRWGRYASDLLALRYEVLMLDYRGFGKSTGTPSEITMYRDASTVLQWAKENLDFDRPNFYGRSLGTAAAAALAVQEQPDTLVLETPFDHLESIIWPVAKPFLQVLPLAYEFPTREFLSQYQGRAVIFHGTRDIVTPLSSALRLKPLLLSEDDFLIIPGGTHWNLRSFRQYHDRLAEVL